RPLAGDPAKLGGLEILGQMDGPGGLRPVDSHVVDPPRGAIRDPQARGGSVNTSPGTKDLAPPWMTWGLAAAIIGILLVWSPGYIAHLLVMFGIYLLLAYSLNLVTGFGGLIVFCHAAF